MIIQQVFHVAFYMHVQGISEDGDQDRE